jgi:hypothetical protein
VLLTGEQVQFRRTARNVGQRWRAFHSNVSGIQRLAIGRALVARQRQQGRSR